MTQPSDLKKILSTSKVTSLWRLMAGYRLIYLGATVAIGLATLMKTASFYLLRHFINDTLENGRYAQVPTIALGFIGLAILQGLFTYLSGRYAAYTGESIVENLRNYLYDHLQRLTFTYHDNQQTGELLQRVTSDVDTVRKLFAQQAVGIGRIIFQFSVNFIAILFLFPRLGWLSIIVVPFVVAISIWFFGRIGRAYEQYQDQDAVVSNYVQENLSGVRVVKAFARQAHEEARFDVQNEQKRVYGNKLTMMHATYWPLTDVMCGVQMIFGFYLGARMVLDGTLTIGDYIAYVGLFMDIIWPIRNLGRLITDGSQGMVSFGRIMDVIREVREPLEDGTHAPNSLRGDIVFDTVSFHYEGNDTILHDISFNAKKGETIALMGGTGSGKTSLTNLLPRFYDHTAGQILLDGVPLTDYSRSFLRNNIGFVMQEPFLFSRTIRENITYGVAREVTDEEVFAATRAAAVHDVILDFPNGYATVVGERGVTLSGGQKQRVTLARTLLQDPRILVLDDATSSVDTETESAIRDALNILMPGRTSFIIAHRIQTVMNADQIIVLDEGRIVQHGTHAELVKQDGIYRRVYTLQSQIETELEEELAGLA